MFVHIDLGHNDWTSEWSKSRFNHDFLSELAMSPGKFMNWAWGRVVKDGVTDCSQAPKHVPNDSEFGAFSQLLVCWSAFLAGHSRGSCTNVQLETRATDALERMQYAVAATQSVCSLLQRRSRKLSHKKHGCRQKPQRRHYNSVCWQSALR